MERYYGAEVEVKSLVVSIACIAALLLTVERSTAQLVEGRQVRRGYAGRIPDLVKGAGKRLTVIDSMDPPLLVPPPAGVSSVEWLSDLASTVVLVEVHDRQSALDKTQEWITSTNRGIVIEVLKMSSERSLNVGHPFAFAERGGIAVLNGTTVVAIVPGVRPIEVGRRYLIFANISEAGALLVGPESTYEVTLPGRLSRLSSRRIAPPNSDMENASLDDVLERIRHAVAKSR